MPAVGLHLCFTNQKAGPAIADFVERLADPSVVFPAWLTFIGPPLAKQLGPTIAKAIAPATIAEVSARRWAIRASSGPESLGALPHVAKALAQRLSGKQQYLVQFSQSRNEALAALM